MTFRTHKSLFLLQKKNVREKEKQNENPWEKKKQNGKPWERKIILNQKLKRAFSFCEKKILGKRKSI